MSVDWNKMMGDVDKVKNVDGLLNFLRECGVDKGEEFRVLKSSVRMYGYNRDYRERRNVGISELKKENERLKKLVESK